MSGRVIIGGKRVTKSVLELTESAVKRLNYLLSKRKEPCVGIRLGLTKKGCNGLAYTMNYATEQKPADEVVKQDGITILIDPQALMKVIGTKMDFIEDPLKSEFVFINPNAKTACGCGESFKT